MALRGKHIYLYIHKGIESEARAFESMALTSRETGVPLRSLKRDLYNKGMYQKDDIIIVKTQIEGVYRKGNEKNLNPQNRG